MTINTKTIKEAISKVNIALSSQIFKQTSVLELVASNNLLFNLYTKRTTVSIKSDVLTDGQFKVKIDAKSFLNLISSLNSDEIELDADDKVLKITNGRSKYTLPLILTEENFDVVKFDNMTQTMTVSSSILQSILDVNSKEILKLKNFETSDSHKMYLLNKSGCFTFSTGACINEFDLPLNSDLVLDDGLVKLFKLFQTDSTLSYGKCAIGPGVTQTVITLSNDNLYLGAVVSTDPSLLSEIKLYAEKISTFMKSSYPHSINLPIKDSIEVIDRIITFNANSNKTTDKSSVFAKLIVTGSVCMIVDQKGNTDALDITVNEESDMSSIIVNLSDIKTILSTCNTDFITMKYGNSKSIILNRDRISNLIPEVPADMFSAK